LTATNGPAEAAARGNIDESSEQSSAAPEPTLRVPAQIPDPSSNSGYVLPPTLSTYLNFGNNVGGYFGRRLSICSWSKLERALTRLYVWGADTKPLKGWFVDCSQWLRVASRVHQGDGRIRIDLD